MNTETPACIVRKSIVKPALIVGLITGALMATGFKYTFAKLDRDTQLMRDLVTGFRSYSGKAAPIEEAEYVMTAAEKIETMKSAKMDSALSKLVDTFNEEQQAGRTWKWRVSLNPQEGSVSLQIDTIQGGIRAGIDRRTLRTRVMRDVRRFIGEVMDHAELKTLQAVNFEATSNFQDQYNVGRIVNIATITVDRKALEEQEMDLFDFEYSLGSRKLIVWNQGLSE